MTAPTAASSPASLTLDAPLKVARWRPLFAWILAIPQLVIARVLGYVAGITAIISWFAIVFTGKDLEGLQGFRCMTIRMEQRAWLYAGFTYEPYPPFSFSTESSDPGDLAGLRVDFQPQLEERNRLTVLIRILMVIPHLVCLMLLGIAAFLGFVVGWFAVLFTGAWPEGLRGFLIDVTNWGVRVEAYMYLLTDEYPPFALS